VSISIIVQYRSAGHCFLHNYTETDLKENNMIDHAAYAAPCSPQLSGSL